MINPNNVIVTRISETVAVGSNGQAQPSIVMTFTVDGHGPFTETFPKTNFDPNAANLRLKEFASKLALLPGV